MARLSVWDSSQRFSTDRATLEVASPLTRNDEFFLSAYRSRALPFFQIGHSVFALVSGIVGAVFATSLKSDSRNDPSSP